jgi:hypothetical protein
MVGSETFPIRKVVVLGQEAMSNAQHAALSMGTARLAYSPLNNDLSGWVSERVAVGRIACCDSFFKCSPMGGSPARLSTPPVGEVRNAPVIQHTAFRCIEVSDLRTPLTLAPSKYHNLWPYGKHTRPIQHALVAGG